MHREWLAVPFSDRPVADQLGDVYDVYRFPTLILVEAGTGRVLTTNGQQHVENDPEGVGEDEHEARGQAKCHLTCGVGWGGALWGATCCVVLFLLLGGGERQRQCLMHGVVLAPPHTHHAPGPHPHTPCTWPTLTHPMPLAHTHAPHAPGPHPHTP